MKIKGSKLCNDKRLVLINSYLALDNNCIITTTQSNILPYILHWQGVGRCFKHLVVLGASLCLE
jgi:hypothetical protein